MDGLTCRMKEYIQPFERKLALQELHALAGSFATPLDGNYETALNFSVPKTCDADVLRRSLAYWSLVGTAERGLTTQLRSEATSLVARNGRSAREVSKNVRLLVSTKLPKTRCLRYATHGLHEYRGKFFPQLVRALMNVAELAQDSLVLDPMCGSGTTLVEARLSGRSCIGLDLNPLSTFVSDVKCQALSLRASDLVDAYDLLLTKLESPSLAPSAWFSHLPEHDRTYLRRWFATETLEELISIKAAVSELPTSSLRNFYSVCLSNILRSVSWQKDADLRVRREIKSLQEGETTSRFLGEAERSTKTVAAFLAERGPIAAGGHIVRRADARKAVEALPELEGRTDAVITSPPYATALPYIDTDRLNLIFLGLLPRKEHRVLDMMMIGNREVTKRGRARYWEFYQANKSALPMPTQCLIEKIDVLNRDGLAGFRRRNLSALLARYFFDMRKTLEQILALLRPGGSLFLVVGNNRTIAGGERVEIETSDHLGRIAVSLGFRMVDQLPMEMLVSRDIFRKNAMRSEKILRFESPQ